MAKYFLALFVCLFLHHAAQAQCSSGIFENYLIIDTHSNGNVYYDLQAATANPDFGNYLGTYCYGTSDLVLNGAENKIYKCFGADIYNGKLFYKVYPTGSPSAGFDSVSMGWLADVPGALCNPGTNQKWDVANANINLLNMCPQSGNYTLEVFTTAGYQFCGNGVHYANNSGANYSATFDVVRNEANAVPNDTICSTQSLQLQGSGASNYTWSGGVSNNVAFVPATSATYTVSSYSAAGNCNATSTIFIEVKNSNNALSNAANFPVTSCNTMYNIDGVLNVYSDSFCNKILSIQDSVGGNMLGSVSACATRSASVNTWNTQPYLPRTFTISPSSNGAARVILYFSNQDILDYNAYASVNSWPTITTLPTASLSNGYRTNFCITNVNGAVVYTKPVQANWSSAGQYFAVPVDSTVAGTYYMHACNPLNAPLSMDALLLEGKKSNGRNELQLTWLYNAEVQKIILEKKQDATTLWQPIHEWQVNVAAQNFVYKDYNQVLQSEYRARAIYANGQEIASNVVTLGESAESLEIFQILPNPSSDEISFSTPKNVELASAKIYTQDGKLLFCVTDISKATDVSFLPQGIYTIVAKTKNGVLKAIRFCKL